MLNLINSMWFTINSCVRLFKESKRWELTWDCDTTAYFQIIVHISNFHMHITTSYLLIYFIAVFKSTIRHINYSYYSLRCPITTYYSYYSLRCPITTYNSYYSLRCPITTYYSYYSLRCPITTYYLYYSLRCPITTYSLWWYYFIITLLLFF